VLSVYLLAKLLQPSFLPVILPPVYIVESHKDGSTCLVLCLRTQQENFPAWSSQFTPSVYCWMPCRKAVNIIFFTILVWLNVWELNPCLTTARWTIVPPCAGRYFENGKV